MALQPIVPSMPYAHADSYQSFQSPSRNIQCAMGSMDNNTFAMCEIGDHTWAAPPRPTPCMGGWGDRISLTQGSAPKMTCHTDTVRGNGADAVRRLDHMRQRTFRYQVCR